MGALPKILIAALAFLAITFPAKADESQVAGIVAPGTSNHPEDDPRRIGSLDFYNEGPLNCVALDSQGGYAYFGTNTSPGKVIKVALNEGGPGPTRVGAVTLNIGEDKLTTALIDPASGYAYFGTFTVPGKVIKVALGAGDEPPSRVASVTLNPGEDKLDSGGIDPTNGFAYFGTYTGPGKVVKVELGAGSSPPRRVGAATLATGENSLTCAVLDLYRGYAYFGTQTSPGIVVKVGMGIGWNPPVRVSSLKFELSENYLQSAVIDALAGHAYFGTQPYASQARVIKIGLGSGNIPPSRIGSAAITQTYTPSSAQIDPTAGYAYFGARKGGSPDRIYRVAINGNGVPSVVDSIDLPVKVAAWALNPVTKVSYIGTTSSPAQISKFDQFWSLQGSLTLPGGEDEPSCGVVDEATHCAYFGTNTIPGRIIKVFLGSGADLPRRVGTLELGPGEDNLSAAAIDAAAGIAYFATDTDPGRIVKLALKPGDELPTHLGALTLDSGESSIRLALLDPARDLGYFTTKTSPTRMVKVGLGGGVGSPVRIGSGALGNLGTPLFGGIDPVDGYAYLGFNAPGTAKISLGSDSSFPALVSSLPVEIGDKDGSASSGIVDVGSGYLYMMGNSYYGAELAKVALENGDATPIYIGAERFGTGVDFTSAIIDPVRKVALFGSDRDLQQESETPDLVLKVRLGEGNDLASKNGLIQLAAGEEKLHAAVYDSVEGYGYFATQTAPGKVVKIAFTTNERDTVRATKITLAEWAEVTGFSFYSHLADGNVRFGIYGDLPGKPLLWQSESTSNTAQNDWVSVPINLGTPSIVTLPPGTYWLAWQTDSKGDVASYQEGAMGDSLLVSQSFGPFPGLLDSEAPTLSSARWSTYITYHSPLVTPSPTSTPSPSMTPTPIPSPTPDPLNILGAIGGNARAVAIQGDLAFVGEGPNLDVIQITDPSNPAILSRVHLPDLIQRIAVSGSMVYVAAYGAGLQIVDVSNPAAPVRRGSYPVQGLARAVAISGNTVFLGDDLYGFKILDISNPDAPALKKALNPGGDVYDVVINGTLAYVANTWNLLIYDISNAAAPVLRGSIDTPKGQAQALALAGNLACVNDRYTMEIEDISNPSSPVNVGSYTPADKISDIDAAGHLAYLWETDRVEIVDFSNPANVTLLGTFSSDGTAGGLALSGSTLYLCDGYKFRTIDVSNPATPGLLGQYVTTSFVKHIAVAEPYAYTLGGTSDGCYIIDFSNPSLPLLRSSVAVNAAAIAVSNSILYLGVGSGIWTYDVSNPDLPVKTDSLSFERGVNSIAIDGTLGYAAIGDYGARVVDFSYIHAPFPIVIGQLSSTLGS